MMNSMEDKKDQFDQYQKEEDIGFDQIDEVLSVKTEEQPVEKPPKKTAPDGPLKIDNQLLKAEEEIQKTDDPSDRLKNKMDPKKKWIIIGIIAFVFVAGYVGGSFFYQSHFYNNATFNGKPVRNQSVEDVIESRKQDAKVYGLTMTKWNDKKIQIKGADFGCEFKDTGEIQKVLDSQNGWAWPAALFGETAYSGKTNFTYDKAKLDKLISGIIKADEGETVPSTNAYPVYENGTIVIKPETYGNTINSEKTTEVIQSAINSEKDQLDLKTEGCYDTPKFKAKDKAVLNAKAAMEKALQASVTYTIDDAKETLGSVTFGPWLKVDDEMKPIVDDESAAAYLAGLGEKYDVAGGPYIFTTTGGNTIDVSNGTYGWAVDEAAELPLLKASILAGEVVTRAPASKGPERRSSSTVIQGTYVEVSLRSQTMWLYVNGECLVSTPVVTGDEPTGHGTPTGVYAIMYHDRDTHLTGKNDDGSEYDSFVHYWMPFVGNIGIHDADGWRGAYGGTIYLSDGSHGCVNTPGYAAEIIYENTADGCPVVVY